VSTSTPSHLPSPGEPGPLARLRGLLEAARAVRGGGDPQPLLEAIARVISVSLGFGTVVINLHRPAWDDFEVAIVHGSDEARRVLLGTSRSWESWHALLDPRFERGGAYFIPHGEFEWDTEGTVSYVPPAAGRLVPADGPAGDHQAGDRPADGSAGDGPVEDWHPEDALLVPMRSSTGRLLGVVSVDDPIGGHRPSDAQLEVLSAVCGHAALAVEHAQANADADRDRVAVQHLLRVSARLTGRQSVDEMLAAVCGGIRDALGYRRVIVSLTDGPDHRLTIRSSIGWSRDEIAALPDTPLSSISRLLRPEHQREGCVLLAREEAELLTPPELHGQHRGQRNGRGPLAWRNHWLLVPLHDRDGAFTGIVWVDEPEDRLLPTTEGLQALRAFANQAISAVESTRRLEHMRLVADGEAADRRGVGSAAGGEQLAAAMLLAETLDLRDPGTARHSLTVGRLAEQTGRRLGWSPARVERVRAAGVLHDIGKLGIPDAILLKPGALDRDEWREIRRHPEIGARILEHANLADIARWVRAHHERVDGGGYPAGLAGTAIPAEARVLAVADAYEAMTADRPYRASIGPDAAEAELRRAAGTQFDAEIVDALIAALADGDDDGLPSPV
jgi:putative nucleotidyltransferase with HDIG domain